MKVRAKQVGNETYSCYHGTTAETMRRYTPGEVFEIADEPVRDQAWADAKLGAQKIVGGRTVPAILPKSKRALEIQALVGMPCAYDPSVMEIVDDGEEITPPKKNAKIPGAPPQTKKGPVTPKPAGAPPTPPPPPADPPATDPPAGEPKAIETVASATAKAVKASKAGKK